MSIELLKTTVKKWLHSEDKIHTYIQRLSQILASALFVQALTNMQTITKIPLGLGRLCQFWSQLITIVLAKKTFLLQMCLSVHKNKACKIVSDRVAKIA